MTAPGKILVPSDGNELEFVQLIKTKTELLYEYCYTKSATKTGNITFTETWLEKYLRNKIFIEIK